MTRSRRPAVLAATVLSVCLVSGCSSFSEQTTELQYAPSDGAQGDAGDLAVRNLLFVAEDAESPGALLGVILNSGSEDIDVTLGSENGVEESFRVPAGSSVSLGPDGDEQVEVDPVAVVPGRTVPVTVTGGADSIVLSTPVLDGSLSDYADLVPTAGSGSSTDG